MAWKTAEKVFHGVENPARMAAMRQALAFSFVVLGVSSVIGQVLLVRELLFVFYGNEFFIGWTLFAWLAWVALGAWLGGRFRRSGKSAARAVVVAHGAAAPLLPASVAFVRASRLLLGTVPGAVPDLAPAVGFSFVALGPLCLLLGAQFVLAARAWKTGALAEESGRVLGRAYALETAGFVAGGLLFGFWLVVENEFRAAGFVGGLNAMAGFALCAGFREKALWPRLALLAAVAAVAAGIYRGERLGRATDAWRFPGQVLVESRQSIYGQLAVVAVDRQLNYYENGLLLGAENEPMGGELLAHLPMLWHARPRRVLLVGNGFNGALGELLRHGPESVDYVELDPVLIDLARKFAAPVRRAALADPRVHVLNVDGRVHLNRLAAAGAAAAYDVVIVNLPNPATALINRFYTREFFRAVRRQLAPGGVLAVRLAFSPDYLGPELAHLGTCIDRTLRAEFGAVAILPDYEIFYLATVAAAPPPTAAELAARYQERNLRTDFVVPPYLEYRLSTDRIGQARAVFAANTTARINRDGRPIACHYNLAYWLRSFHPRAAEIANRLGALGWPWGAGAAAAAVLGLALAGLGRGARRLGAWAMGIGSFTLMAGELVLLLAFQTFCGYLYYKLALILAALMLGMALGTALGTRWPANARPQTLAGMHAGLAAYAVGLALFLHFAGNMAWRSFGGLEACFLALAAVMGGLVGFEFPVANRIYLAGEANPGRREAVVYAVDLIGSCLGALGIGLWALPVLGMGTTLAVLAGLNAATALVVAISKLPESSRRPA